MNESRGALGNDVDESVPSQQGLKHGRIKDFHGFPDLLTSPFHHNKD